MMTTTTATEAYQAIIDQLVNEVRTGGGGARLAMNGVLSNAPSDKANNAFIKKLSDKERKLLVGMLLDERSATIHDVLAALDWWVDCQNVKLTFNDEAMPSSLSDEGMHGDYVGRRDGWKWPKASKKPAKGKADKKTQKEAKDSSKTVTNKKYDDIFENAKLQLMSCLCRAFSDMSPAKWSKALKIINGDIDRVFFLFPLAHDCETMNEFLKDAKDKFS